MIEGRPLEKSWHEFHCVPPEPKADMANQLEHHFWLGQPQNPSQHSTPSHGLLLVEVGAQDETTGVSDHHLEDSEE